MALSHLRARGEDSLPKNKNGTLFTQLFDDKAYFGFIAGYMLAPHLIIHVP